MAKLEREWERVSRLDLHELVSKQQRLAGQKTERRSTSALMLPSLDYHIDQVAEWLGVPPLPPEGYAQAAVQGESGRWYDPLRLMCALIEAWVNVSREVQRLQAKEPPKTDD